MPDQAVLIKKDAEEFYCFLTTKCTSTLFGMPVHFSFYNPFVISLATYTPLADAWDRECVTPLPKRILDGMEAYMAFRCLVWVGLSGGDGAEVEFAAGQVDHGAEVAHVLESAGSGLDVLDDAVESFEDRVGVGVVEVGEDVPPVAAYLAGELFHGFESGARHPRAQTLEGRLGLGSIGAGVVDVLEGLAHLTGASGFQSSPLQAALGFQLQAGQVRFVPQPQVLGPLEQRVAAGLLFADLVDGLVGVFDHVELVDDSRRVGQPLADALGEPQAHVAGNQTHPVGIAVVVHEIPREPFDRGRVLARDHADYVALHQVGDHGDVPVALPAGLVDAYGLHARVVLVKPRLVHVMADEPPQAGVMFADLLGDVRDRLAFGQLHDHRLEQEREPASRPRPRHRDRVHAVGGARHARHARVNERLVLEEVQMPPHALPRVMHRTRGLAAPRFRAGEPRTRREPDRDMQFPSAVLLVTELHARHPPRVRQLQGGGEQRRGIHTPKLPDQHHHPPTHSPTPNSERPSFIGKGELFPSAGKFHGFCDSGFPGVRSADNAVQPACEINGGFHSVLSDCRNSTYPCVSHNWLFSFVIRFMMVS